MTSRLLLAALLLALAGCGQLPRPFEPPDKQANPLLVPPEGLALLVLRPTGVVPTLDDGGASLLAKGLQLGGIKASSVSRPATGADLRVHVISRQLDSEREQLQLEWQVLSPEGAQRGSQRQEIVAPAGAWADGDAWVLVAVAEVAANKLVPLVAGPEPAEAAKLPPAQQAAPLPSIMIGRITGAPGDGNERLGESLVVLLAKQGYRMVQQEQAESQPGQVLVEGQVSLGPPEAGEQPIALTWVVLDAVDGAELGRLEQKNRVPAGSLDGDWGETAVFAAMGAVEGIENILERTGRL